MSDERLKQLFTDRQALEAELASQGPIARIVNMLALSADKHRAQFFAIDIGHVRFWIDGEWYEELTPPPEVSEHMVRRLGVLLGALAPAKGQSRTGSLHLAAGDKHIYMLARIDRDEDARLRALVELVSEADFVTRKEPRQPSQHPYRR